VINIPTYATELRSRMSLLGDAMDRTAPQIPVITHT